MTKPQINVTPLIDVLLVLLIIFMVVTPMKPSAFDAKIPAEPDNDPSVKVPPDTLIVSVGADSKLRLNRDDLPASVQDPGALIDRIRAVFELRTQNGALVDNAEGGAEQRIQKTVFIKAPRALDYGSVAKVVDAVKTAGASPVSLQIDGLD
ncbi:MAG: biopolymer transporter ExbD [Pyrinomonadaceae bacterium]